MAASLECQVTASVMEDHDNVLLTKINSFDVE